MTAAATSAADNPSPLEKYLFKPFFGSSHHWAIGKALELPPSTRVLDIGAGSGPLGRALKEAAFKELDAVEIDARARDAIRSVYTNVAADITPYAGKSYDLILILDVLEHLADPLDMLGMAVSMLAPGGKLLVSVPNVAHWSVRLPLLFGSFNYTSRGILDRTHLQFFTRRRVQSIFAGIPELSALQYAGSIPPAEFVLPKAFCDTPVWRMIARAHVACANALPGFFAYQHLVYAEKK